MKKLPTLMILLVLAVAMPFAINLAQKTTENRSHACASGTNNSCASNGYTDGNGTAYNSNVGARTYVDPDTHETVTYFSNPSGGGSSNNSQAAPAPTATPVCLNLWWFDDTHLTCTQKQFCGAYQYAGLYAYATQAECESNLITLGKWPILNFKFTFGGVETSAKCAVNWPLSVSVLSADKTVKTYAGVIPTESTTSGDLKKFTASVKLVSFPYFSDVAAFVKGPKHLQMKYGADNQTTSYDKPGGTLTLTNDATTSTVYNFMDYPLMAGDINQDGVVDGQDFSLVKTASIARTLVADGGNISTDLNGNCQMESQDVSLLMLSLNDKQGQLY